MDTFPDSYGGGQAHCVEDGRETLLQYFGSIGSPGPETTTFPPVNVERTKMWQQGASHIRLWRVVSTLREVQRFGEGLRALQLQSILFGGPEVDVESRGINRSLLRLRISATEVGGQGIGRTWDIDAGGSLEFWAKSVDVSWVSPPDVDNVLTNLNRIAASDYVIDGLLGVKILGVETPLCAGAPLTDYRGIGQNAEVAIPVPRGARDVTVYQSSAGTASTAWRWTYGDPLTVQAWEVGELPFVAGQRRTHTISVPPSATHLVSDANNNSLRLYSVVWTIRP